MDIVKIPLLQYTFHFRRLSWREEFGIKFSDSKNRIRTILSHSLTDISGLKINSVEEAEKVLSAIPSSIIDRVFVIWQGSLPSSRIFSTLGLWKAPETTKYAKRIKFEEEEREKVMDKVEAEMARKFGHKDLEETRSLERQMLEKSKGRGLTKATPEN